MCPGDSEALEGERKCEFAIENRIKFEKIRDYMGKGVALFQKGEYNQAKTEFDEVIKLDAKNREANDYIEKITELLEEKMLYAQRQKQAEEAYRSAKNNIAQNHFPEAQDDLESCLSLIKGLQGRPGAPQEHRPPQEGFRAEGAGAEAPRDQRDLPGRDNGLHPGELQAGNRFVRADPLSLDRKNDHAREYLQRARDALRIAEEESVDENSPYYDVIRSIALAGTTLYNKGEFVESRKKWDSILTLFPQNKQAREYIIKCDLKINPENKENVVASRVMEGKGYLDRKDYRNALRTFTIIKSIDREYPGLDNLITQANEGLKESEAGNLTAAERADNNRRYQEAMNLYPGRRQGEHREGPGAAPVESSGTTRPTSRRRSRSTR